jgi:hypothetical protein
MGPTVKPVHYARDPNATVPEIANPPYVFGNLCWQSLLLGLLATALGS